MPGLEDTDNTKEEELKGEPLSRTNPIKDHVGGNLEKNNAQREHLLTNVELILSDPDIFEEVIG